MTNKQYLSTQTTLLALCELVTDMDLKSFIERTNKAVTVGPLIDPTLYRNASDNINRIVMLARAARKFQKEIVES